MTESTMTKPMNNTKLYRCSLCGLSFESAWTDEEAIAEFQNEPAFANDDITDTAVTCDDCHNAFMSWLKGE